MGNDFDDGYLDPVRRTPGLPRAADWGQLAIPLKINPTWAMMSVLQTHETSQTKCFPRSNPGPKAWGNLAFLCLELDTTLDVFYGESTQLMYKRPIYGLSPFTFPKLFYKGEQFQKKKKQIQGSAQNWPSCIKLQCSQSFWPSTSAIRAAASPINNGECKAQYALTMIDYANSTTRSIGITSLTIGRGWWI